MELYHTTPKANLPNIDRQGLDPAYHLGKMEVVWFHTYARCGWAKRHLSAHHQTDELMTLTVDIPRSWLKRRRWGIWYTDRQIPPERIHYPLKGIIQHGGIS